MQLPLWLWVLVLAVPGGVATQDKPDKPDFSGQWILVSPTDSGPTVAKQLTVHQSMVRQSVLGDPITPFFKTLAVERLFPGGVRSDSYEIGMIGGWVGRLPRGGQGCAPNGQPARTAFSVKWDADRLVIQTASYSCPTPDVGPHTEHEEVWSAHGQGRLLSMTPVRGA